MKKIYYCESDNTLGEIINKANYELVATLANMTGIDLQMTTNIDDLKDDAFSLVFIGGGGTEGRFKSIFNQLPRPIILMTTGENNSLAASMEILCYLQQEGVKGEILHGGIDYMAKRIKNLFTVFSVKEKISHFRIGRVGVPSDWLISSNVDAKTSKETTGIEIIDVDMQEFFEEINKASYEENQYTLQLKAKGYCPKDTEKALEIYGALKRICTKYQLNGVTVRCFDLLEPVKNTGCVALAILNAEGIYAGCEGDTPALIAMSVIGELSQKPVFMANPSRITLDKNEIIFAHCTLPINMPTCFECMTHFESGLGVAFQAELPLGDLTIFKCSGYMDRYFVKKGTLLENLKESNLCRTQLRIKMDELDYFLTRSIGNHHLIVCGDYVDLCDEFFKWF